MLISVINRITSSLPEKVPADTYKYNGWTFEVYYDELHLTIEDLIKTDYDGYSYEIRTLEKSVFIEQKEATQRPRKDALVNHRNLTTLSLRSRCRSCTNCVRKH